MIRIKKIHIQNSNSDDELYRKEYLCKTHDGVENTECYENENYRSNTKMSTYDENENYDSNTNVFTYDENENYHSNTKISNYDENSTSDNWNNNDTSIIISLWHDKYNNIKEKKGDG